MAVTRLKVPGDPRFNPGPRTFCDKCSERNNLSFAYAYGKPIFLCDRHYREWYAKAQKDKEIVRQQPFKQQTTIDGGARSLEYYYGRQNKRVF